MKGEKSKHICPSKCNGLQFEAKYDLIFNGVVWIQYNKNKKQVKTEPHYQKFNKRKRK